MVLLAHGAALATAVWSRPNTTWVEMTPYLNGSSLTSLLARQDLHQGRDHLQILARALGPTSGVGLRHIAVSAPEAHTSNTVNHVYALYILFYIHSTGWHAFGVHSVRAMVLLGPCASHALVCARVVAGPLLATELASVQPFNLRTPCARVRECTRSALLVLLVPKW